MIPLRVTRSLKPAKREKDKVKMVFAWSRWSIASLMRMSLS